MSVTLRPGEVPDGCVQLKFLGRINPGGKWFQRPIPVMYGGYDPADGVQVGEDGVGVFTVEEWAYFKQTCPEAFVLYQSREPEPLPPTVHEIPIGFSALPNGNIAAGGPLDDVRDSGETLNAPVVANPTSKGRKR